MHTNNQAHATHTPKTMEQILVEALKATVKPLERLGDFIGNEDKGGASGLGPFDRCAILLQVRNAIDAYESQENCKPQSERKESSHADQDRTAP